MQLFETELVREDNLLKRFEEIHDYIYANDGLSAHQTLNEFINILFVKLYDESNSIRLFDDFSVSGVEKINKVFDEIKQKYKDIFDENDTIKLSQNSLIFIVKKLKDISLQNSSGDVSGLAFQKFLSHKEKDGNGQFFTPPAVIDFCVEIINPNPGETIIDPCCGSGGFLFSSFKHLLKNGVSDKKQILSNQIFGTDINRDIAKIAKMKFLLEENTATNIHCQNSLNTLSSLQKLFEKQLAEQGGFDIVLTNPPFGASGKITDTSVLKSFDLGYKWIKNDADFVKSNALCNGQPAEILFVERCLQLLKEGGRMGIVLPNGHFENPSLEYLRYYIKLKTKILAVVNLPQETFIPYGTGVKTSLLFLQKDTPNLVQQYPVFFSKVKKLGYQGNKNGTPIYKKDEFGRLVTKNGAPIIDEDFSTVLSDYQSFNNHKTINTDNSFSLNYNELNGRFDYDFYSPENRDILNRLAKKSVRLGEIVDIVKQKSQKLKNKNSTVQYVELSDVNSHSFEIINSTEYIVHELPSRASYELKENDIVTAIAGNSVGTYKHATAFVSKDYDGAICTNGFRVLRNPKINEFYLLYYFRTDMFLKQMMMYRTGAAIPNVSDNDLQNILVYLPEESIISRISSQMQKSFALRNESMKMIEEIAL